MRGASLAESSALVAVLEQKSFTKAAKLLGLSTPRVSDMVRSLEERLGVRLVERTTRSVAPTAAGERLLARLRPALDEYQAALESTNEFRNNRAGTLRLSVRPPAADLVLEEAIPRFLALYPEINVEISIDASPIDIVAERFDAGIRTSEYLAARHDRRADLHGDAFCRGRRPRLSRAPRRTQDAAGLGRARLHPRSPAERRFRSVAPSNETPDRGGSCGATAGRQ